MGLWRSMHRNCKWWILLMRHFRTAWLRLLWIVMLKLTIVTQIFRNYSKIDINHTGLQALQRFQVIQNAWAPAVNKNPNTFTSPPILKSLHCLNTWANTLKNSIAHLRIQYTSITSALLPTSVVRLPTTSLSQLRLRTVLLVTLLYSSVTSSKKFANCSI